MLSRLFDRWSKSRSFTSNELAVLRLLLPVGLEYPERLYLQATNAPYVERKIAGKNGYEAIIPYVSDDSMLIECDEHIDSPTISTTTSTGMTMNFSTTILRGGFLCGLKGRVDEGIDWPREWAVDVQKAKLPSNIRTWVPASIGSDARNRTIDKLFAWCGIKSMESVRSQGCAMVRVTEPASNAHVRTCEARLGVRLGEQYCQLISITNGFGIQRGRPYEFLGTADLDYVNGAHEWLCLTPLYEEGCVAMRCNEGTASNECYCLSGDGEPIHVGDIKQHVVESLLWEKRTQKKNDRHNP